jgi:putative hydrolase of the HAD superfamily
VKKLDALILDLGNVLVFHDNELLFSRLAQAFGTDVPQMKSKLDDDVWQRVNTGRLTGDALRLQLQKNLGAELSAERFYELWNSHFALNHPMVAKVESLVGKVKLALLSNTHDLHVKFLRPQLPVLERFDTVVLSYEEGLMKPDAAFYGAALKRLNVEPSRAAFFDDVQRYADAASAVGIHGRLFTTVANFELQLRELGL